MPKKKDPRKDEESRNRERNGECVKCNASGAIKLSALTEEQRAPNLSELADIAMDGSLPYA